MADVAAVPGARPMGGRSLAAGSDRLRRRRAAETRLKAYGIAAILVAALALVALLGSVVVQASGALTETYVTVEVTIDPETLEVPDNASPQQILRGDFEELADEVIEGQFPGVTGRTERRELDNLLSGGAPFELAAQVAESPELLGETITYAFLASDTVDLYLQNQFGRLREQPSAGVLSVIEQSDGQLAVSTTSNDFAEALGVVKQRLERDADIIRQRASRQERAVRVYTERASSAETEEQRSEQLERAQGAEAEAQRLIAEAEALEARASQPSRDETLDDHFISLLIRVGDGWLRMTSVGRTTGTAEALTPVDLPIDGTEEWEFYTTTVPEADRRISDRQIVWIETLRDEGKIERVFNTRFFSAADSRAPELAGIWGAVVGSFWTMLVTFSLAFPIGVLGAIYLEEFAPKNRFTQFVEVNINNLAAVPSIVFGLLGLAVFLNFFGVPRSSPLAGGFVLALMTLPTIIIAARAAIRAVPPSIREAALGVGASDVQASFHHVLPLAMPGILTGTIIGMAQALGETAPLLLIGMVAFIVDVPTGVTDNATVLPVQIYRWSDFPEQAFEARTAAAICVLLAFLVVMNLLAILLRRRFERRW